MTDNAKTALAALRDSDHPLGRPLALCLMFEPANDQLLVASIFDLALALDSALHIPSESLLAGIRVQWWVDALTDNDAQTAPLVTQLHAQFQTHEGLQSDTIDLIGYWQTACHDENRDNSDGWAAVWAFVAKHLGQAGQAASSAQRSSSRAWQRNACGAQRWASGIKSYRAHWVGEVTRAAKHSMKTRVGTRKTRSSCIHAKKARSHSCVTPRSSIGT